MSYAVTIRGPVPPDLAHKIAEAHAQALKSKGPRLGEAGHPAGLDTGDPPPKLAPPYKGNLDQM